MRILDLSRTPIAVLPYLNAGPGGKAIHTTIPVYEARATGLPDGVDAVVATADLQGRLPDGRLVGLGAAELLSSLASGGHLPPADRTGVILAGDVWAREDTTRRGGSGDVREVWGEFHARFRWVAGVAGNHDLIGSHLDFRAMEAFRRTAGRYFLDGNAESIDGMVIGGVSGLVGDPKRAFRRTEIGYLEAINSVLLERPRVLVLHDGPDHPPLGLGGLGGLREWLELWQDDLLVIRGHHYWNQAVVELSPTCQVLNVDHRIVVLRRDLRSPT